jgi:hypothetical protein
MEKTLTRTSTQYEADGLEDGEYAYLPPANLNLEGHTCSYGMHGFISGSEASTPASPKSNCRHIDISFLPDDMYRSGLQNAIDGANSAGANAWSYIAEGKLLKVLPHTVDPQNPIASSIFRHMDKDKHSGFSMMWTISALTCIAKDYDGWKAKINPLAAKEQNYLDHITGVNKEKND